MPPVFLPQTYRSPLEVIKHEDSSEQLILVTGKLVKRLSLCGIELKFPLTPRPS